MGEIQKELESNAGDGILVDEIEIRPIRKRQELPAGFWLGELPSPYLEAWERENRSGQEFYFENRTRMI